MRIEVSRKEHFNAAHRLHNPQWTLEKNAAVFGKCNNANGHGHNYEVIAHVKGEVDPETGYVIDMKILKDIMKEEILEPFDHKHLNLDTEAFKELNPTAEHIAYVIWQKMRPRIKPDLEFRITLFETERNFVEYDGK